MKKSSPRKRCPKGTRRDPKTKQCIKKTSSANNKKNSKKSKKTITFDYDGGLRTETLHFPKVELSYISPGNSEGIFNEDFSGFDFTGSNLTYSNFTNCNFRKTNMKGVNMDNSRFQGSDFRGAIGLTMKQKKIIKSTGGLLTDKDVTTFKEQQKKIGNLAKEYNKLKKQISLTKDKIFKIANSNPAHGDTTYVINRYKVFSL